MIGRLLEKMFGSGADVSWSEFYLRKSWPIVAAVLAGVVVAYAVYLYRSEARLGRGRRVMLGVFRALVLAILVLVLFEPVVGIENKVKIRRNVLVLLDASESMGIKDARKSPEELESAALALGKAEFTSPRLQQALARAQRVMGRCLRQLDRNDPAEAGREMSEAAAALREAVGVIKPPAGTAPPRLAPAAARVETILAEQDRLVAQITAKDFSPSALPEVSDRQAGLRTQLTEVLANLHAPAPMAEAVKTEVAEVARMALAKGILSGGGPAKSWRLGEDYNIRYFRFGQRLEPTAGTGETVPEALADAKADAPVTRLGSAIDEAVGRYTGQPISGVVVLTDGASNDGLDPLVVAGRMRERGIPVFPVPLGLPQAEDVQLRGLIAADTIFQKDKVPVRVQVVSHGYDKRTVNLTATLDGVEVARKTVVLAGPSQFEELSFQPEDRSGTVKLELAVSPLPGEVTENNNRISQPVRVIDEKIKVLYIEGVPRWEYRYLRAVLKRDHRLEVKFLLSEGDPDLAKYSEEYLRRFPNDAAELFQYDLVILGDVPVTFFTAPQLARIKQLVLERGGSFLSLAGSMHNPSSYTGPQGKPIADILPVKLQAQPAEKLADTVHPVVTAAGRKSMLTSLAPTEVENSSRWAVVKPLYEVAAVSGVKGGATVLAELSDSASRREAYPLIAWQRAGSGKSLMVATDQLWRLRFKTGDKFHARFWGQAIQFLTLSRLLGENKRIRIETAQKTYHVGDRIEVYANVLNENYEPVASQEYTVHVERTGAAGDPAALKLQNVRNAPGLFQGFYMPRQDGHYRIRTAKDEEEFASAAEFHASSVSVEQMEPAMQAELLRKMAELSGGRVLNVRDVPSLPGLLESGTTTAVIRKEKELWDIWPVLAAVLALAAMEWYVRRRSDLV